MVTELVFVLKHKDRRLPLTDIFHYLILPISHLLNFISSAFDKIEALLAKGDVEILLPVSPGIVRVDASAAVTGFFFHAHLLAQILFMSSAEKIGEE